METPKTSSSIAINSIYAAMPTIDRGTMQDAFNTIAGFETNNQSINQVGGSERGQGIFQFEKGMGGGAHTALGRLINVLSNDGLPDFVNPVQLDDNVKQELILKAQSLLTMEDPDLSKQSTDFQNLMMLTDKIFHKGWSMQGVSDGKINYFDAYTKGHWAGNDPKVVETYKKRWKEEGHKMFYGKIKGGFIDMEDGGEVPSLTSEVLPTETVESTLTDNIPSADTVDTEQGFYENNPAPGESSEEFERRTRKIGIYPMPGIIEGKRSSFKPPEDYVSPRVSTSFLDILGNQKNTGGTYTGGSSSSSTTNSNTSSSTLNDFSIVGTMLDVAASGQWDRKTIKGLNEDSITTALDNYSKTFFNPDDFSEAEFYKGLWTTNTIDTSGIETTKTDWFQKYIYDDTFASNTDIKLNELLEGKYKDINGYAAANGDAAARALLNEAIMWTSIDETIETIKTIELDTTFKFGSSNNVGLLRNKDGSLMRYDATEGTTGGALIGAGGDTEFLYNEDGSIKTREVNGHTTYVTNKGLIIGGGVDVDVLEKDGTIAMLDQMNSVSNVDDILQNLDSFKTGNANAIRADLDSLLNPKSTSDLFDTIGNYTIGSDEGFNVQIKGLYDEFATAFAVSYLTGDNQAALGAAAGQFLKSNVVDYFTDQTFQAASTGFSKTIAGATSVADINVALKDAGYATVIDPNTDLAAAKETAGQAVGGIESTKFSAYAGAAAAMAQTLLMGGSEEDAVISGGEYIAVELGAEALGSSLGFSGVEGSFTDPTAIGGALISGIASYIRTGRAEDAANSAATSYLFSVNPVAGMLLMSATMLAGNPDPKNYAAYTALNLEDMSVQSYSHGDVDSNKASPENLAITQKVMESVTPILSEIKETYKINKILGDLEIQYGDRDGLYLSISTDKEVTGFTNRVSYNEKEGDLNRDQIYQKKFDNIDQLQEHLIELFNWSAENMTVDGVLDLTELVGRRKEKMNETLLASLGSGYSSVGSLMNDPRGGNYETGGKIQTNEKLQTGFVNTGYLEDNVEPNVYDEKQEDKRDTSDYITEGYLDSIEFYSSQAAESKLTGDLEAYKEDIESKKYYIKKYREEFKEKTGEYPPEEAYTFFEGPSVDSDFQEEMVLKKIDESKNKGFRIIGRGKVPETWRDNEKDLHEQVMKWQDSNAFVNKRKIQEEGYSGNNVGKLEIISGREKILYNFNNLISYVKQYGIDHKITKEQVGYYIGSIDKYENTLKTVNKEYPSLDMSKWDYSMLPTRDSDWDSLAESLRGTSKLEKEEKRSGIVQPRDEDITEKLEREEKEREYKSQGLPIPGETMAMVKGGKIPLDKNQKVLYNSNQAKNYGLVDKKGKAAPSKRADDVPMNLNEGDYVLSQPAVNLYGKDTIERMVNRASKEAGTNLKSGGKVPVNVHNGEYIIPKNLTKYIGSSVLENMNNRGLMSVGDKTNT